MHLIRVSEFIVILCLSSLFYLGLVQQLKGANYNTALTHQCFDLRKNPDVKKFTEH